MELQEGIAFTERVFSSNVPYKKQIEIENARGTQSR